MENQMVDLGWGARKRLHYLEFKLFWEGRVNRGDLISTFGISTPQATNDISRYQKLAPNNTRYNLSAKYYVPTETFTPKFIKPSADAYFSEVNAFLDIDNSNLQADNYIGFVPNPNRIVDENILKSIVQAIKYKQKITVDYRSFKNPQAGSYRTITPHAFGTDGFRWHVRAYCHKDNVFKDYVLGRIVDVSSLENSDIDISADCKWFNFIDVIIGPNPKQSDDQKFLIEIDYGMKEQKLVIRCRIALLWYLLKKLGLEKKGDERAGEEQHIVLINRDEVSAAME